MAGEYREFILWAVAVFGIVYASLQIMGYVRMNAGRWGLFIAWLVAVGAAAATLPDAAPWKHRVITASIIGIPFGLLLLILGRHAARNVRERESIALGAQAAEEKGLEPNIVCEGDADLFVTLDKHGIFRIAEPLTAPLRAAAVKFTNMPKPPHKVARVVNNVRAQLIFNDFEWAGKEDHRVDYGCWLNEASPYVSFNLGDKAVHYLIVAVFELIKEEPGGYKPGLIIYGNNPDRNTSLPQFGNRFCRGYRVRVNLMVGENGEYSKEYDFELRGEPTTSYGLEYITEEEKRKRGESFAHELERSFIATGERFFLKPAESTDWDKYYSDAHEWRNKVYAFIKAHHGTSVAHRFLEAPELKPFPHETPKGRDRFLDELYTQFVNLKEMAKGYGTEKQPISLELIIEQLSELLNEGNGILKKLEGYPAPEPSTTLAREWGLKVTNFLKDNDLKVQAIRFSSEVITHKYVGETTQRTRELFHWLQTRIMRLDKIIEDLSRNVS